MLNPQVLPAVFDEFFTIFLCSLSLLCYFILLFPYLGFLSILLTRMLWSLPYHRAFPIARSGSGTASILQSLLRRRYCHLRRRRRRRCCRRRSRCCLWQRYCHHHHHFLSESDESDDDNSTFCLDEASSSVFFAYGSTLSSRSSSY